MNSAIKAQCSASYKGMHRETIALPYVVEYNARSRLRKLGYTSDLSGLDMYKAQIFLRIADEYDKIEVQEMKKKK